MKLNFDFKFKDLTGKETEFAAHAGEILGNLLASDTSKKNQAVRFFSWAIKLHDKTGLDLEKADQTTLREFIESVDGLTALMRAQLLDYMDDAKIAADKKASSKSK